MKTLPKKWFIEPTKETVLEICKWFDENHTDQEKGNFYQKTLQIDTFCYTNAFEKGDVYYYRSSLESKGIEEITIDQFRQITNPVSDNVTLPKSFVLELHDKLNYTFRKRIEEVVPELFPKNEIPDELQTLIKKLGKDKIIEIINSN